MKKRVIGSLVSILAVVASPIAAQDAQVWDTIGNWTIAVDTTLDNSCFALTVFEGDTYLRLGLNVTEAMLPYYMILGNPSWRSIEEGKDYELTLQFDNAPAWTATAVGTYMGDLPSLMLQAAEFDFIDEFARKHTLQITFMGRRVDSLSLSGSARATQELATCQIAMDRTGLPSTDPFETRPASAPKDPFAI
ncbi:hypothetical protein [Pelagibacterium mangrovi]|uniref:hypothetical protein n=1 Tax=Pelagibacterium mangrovi TaxID=3119828 RepID=UPI002FCAC61C